MGIFTTVPPELEPYEDDLAYFFATMVRKLHTNRHRGTRNDLDVGMLVAGVENELAELREALQNEGQFAAAVEAVDVGNFAFMVAAALWQMTREDFDKMKRPAGAADSLPTESDQHAPGVHAGRPDGCAVDMGRVVRWSRRLAFVPRWVVMPTLRRQSVAEHTFQVTQTVRWLLPMHARADADFRAQVVCLALDHDLDEARTGDAPSPTKKGRDAQDAGEAYVVVKVADLLEAIAFVREETLMGNQYGMSVVETGLRAKLHDWWSAFEWGGEGRKPLTSDVVNAYLSAATPADSHPVLEHD